MREIKVYKICTGLNSIYLINETINTLKILISVNIIFMIISNSLPLTFILDTSRGDFSFFQLFYILVLLYYYWVEYIILQE